jgi:transcription antitermination factor NusG
MDHSTHEVDTSGGLSWLLVYTKARAEAWTDINLRSQGFETLIPRVAARGGFRPLFPRYVFVGAEKDVRTRPVRSTLGVLYVVHSGEQPAAVPTHVIDEIRGRMNENGVVHLERTAAPDELFAQRERDRIRALIKLTAAGFRVRSA